MAIIMIDDDEDGDDDDDDDEDDDDDDDDDDDGDDKNNSNIVNTLLCYRCEWWYIGHNDDGERPNHRRGTVWHRAQRWGHDPDVGRPRGEMK